MKKTLITLMALAGAAMAEGENWILSTAPEYNGSQGGSYSGVCFTLASGDTERFSVTGGELTAKVALSSISLTERGNNDLDADRVLYITDSNNTYLGSSALFTKETGSDVAVFDFGGTITLNTAETYYAYILIESGDDNWIVGETMVPARQYHSAQLAAAGGSLTAANAANWGLLNAQQGYASTGYTPVMSISVTALPSVPEPATATLSLLALAGLAARRRRK